MFCTEGKLLLLHKKKRNCHVYRLERKLNCFPHFLVVKTRIITSLIVKIKLGSRINDYYTLQSVSAEKV